MRLSLVASLFLFFSGVTALIYQTLWVKQLALVVGVDVYAVTVGVSAFFAGLALGNAWLGRQADRTPTPMQLYGWLEVGIAATGVGATWALAHADRPFVLLQDMVGPLAWALPFLLVGIPATFMGGTVVTLLRACHPLEAALGKTSGLLYAANTAGAIAGTLTAAFFWIPVLGLQRTAWLAAAINLSLGLIAWLVQSRWPSLKAVPQRVAEGPSGARLVLVLYTLAGGLALGYEVVWSQAIVQFLSTRAYAFAVVLATYLYGLSLGSWLMSVWSDRLRQPWLVFGSLLAGAGITALAAVTSLGYWLLKAQYEMGQLVLQLTHSHLLMKLASFSVAAAVFVLVPTLLLGAAYPLAVRLTARPAQVGGDTGRLTALNTLGGIVGTGLTGFVLIPRMGLVHSLAALAGLAVVVGAIAIGQSTQRSAARLAIGGAVLSVIGLGVITPGNTFAQMLTLQHPGQLTFYQESVGATVAVIEQPTKTDSFHRLYIQGVSNTGDAFPSLRYMRLQSLLPLTIHSGEPKSALIVGLGSGITSGSLLAYSALERSVVIELLPAVVEAASVFNGNFDVTHDPRMTVQVSDGRHALLRSPETFDLITLEPPPPSAAGVVNLYSRDFYKLCKTKLTPDGLLAQWWPLATQNEEDSKSLVRSLLDAFPYVILWSTELHEMLVIGSQHPITLDPEQIAQRFNQPAVKAALSEVGVQSPQALLATYVTDRAGLEDYVGNAPAVTDDRPLIEYADWVRPREFERVLPNIMQTATPVPLPADHPWQPEIDQEQYNLWRVYRAELDLYQDEFALWYDQITQVIEADPENSYYQWFFQAAT